MSHYWLQRKRKGELIDLAQKAGLPEYVVMDSCSVFGWPACSADGYLKDDLVEMLENHLNSHETSYAKHPEFRDYYGRNASPVKRERSSPSEAVTATKTRRRTLIKAPSYVYKSNATRQG
jgi:hypothetical protein